MLAIALLFAAQIAAEKIAQADALIAEIQKTPAPHVEERAQVTRLLHEAVGAAPHDTLVITRFAEWTARETTTDLDAFARTVLPVVRAADDPDAVRHTANLMDVNDREILLADALAQRPHDTALWQELVDDYWQAPVTATFGPVRIAGDEGSLRDEWKSVGEEGMALSAAKQIDALSQLGRARDLLIVLRALPEPVRDRVLADDVRFDIALAALVTGEHIDVQLAAPVRDSRRAGRVKILEMLQRPEHADPFDFLADVIGHAASRPWAGLWADAVARIAEGGGYSRLACEIRNRADSPFSLTFHGNALDYLPQSMRDELHASLKQDREPVQCSAPDGASATIERLISQPPLAHYREKPLDVGATEVDAVTPRLPDGFYLIRAERDGDSMIAIGADQRNDSGYWVLRSGDGGRTWDKPLFTGLFPGSPYRIVETPKQRMNAGDHLDVEVTATEHNPPLSITPKESGIALEIPWATLTRDSDGDGFTDLAEQLFVTDWNDPTSFPHPPAPQQSSLQGQVIAAILKYRKRDSGFVFISGTRHDFAGVATKAILIVRTPDEWKKYQQNLGTVRLLTFPFVFVSADGTKALAVVDESTSETSYLLTKNGDDWEVRVLESRIS